MGAVPALANNGRRAPIPLLMRAADAAMHSKSSVPNRPGDAEAEGFLTLPRTADPRALSGPAQPTPVRHRLFQPVRRLAGHLELASRNGQGGREPAPLQRHPTPELYAIHQGVRMAF